MFMPGDIIRSIYNNTLHTVLTKEAFIKRWGMPPMDGFIIISENEEPRQSMSYFYTLYKSVFDRVLETL